MAVEKEGSGIPQRDGSICFPLLLSSCRQNSCREQGTLLLCNADLQCWKLRCYLKKQRDLLAKVGLLVYVGGTVFSPLCNIT